MNIFNVNIRWGASCFSQGVRMGYPACRAFLTLCLFHRLTGAFLTTWLKTFFTTWCTNLPSTFLAIWICPNTTLKWRHNERNGVSNRRHLDGLLNHLFGHRSKKTLKLRVTGLCEGNSPVTDEFPLTKDQWHGKYFHLMTSVWVTVSNILNNFNEWFNDVIIQCRDSTMTTWDFVHLSNHFLLVKPN